MGNFDITNTSGVPLTWHVSGNPATMTLSPPSSTLPVGGAITVSVSSSLAKKASLSVVSIDADVAPSQSLEIRVSYLGAFLWFQPPDVDFGNVPVGVSSTITIQAAGNYPDMRLQSSNPAFSLPGSGTQTGTWPLTFLSQTPGPQQSTLTFFSGFGTVCPPNTFIARATAVAP